MNLKTKPPLSPIKVKKPNAKGMLTKLVKRYSTFIIYTLILCGAFIGIIYLFGGDDYSFASYLWVQLLVIILGILHHICSVRIFEWATPISSWKQIFYTVTLSGFGVGLVFLSRHWEWLPTLPFSYGLAWVLFLVPLIYMIAIGLLHDIPGKIFKPWIYPYGKEIPVVEVINPIKVKFYIAKKQEDDEYTEFALNVPHKYKLGDFMHYFIHRYNYDKNPESPIYMSKNNSRDNLYRWLFKAKPATTKNSQIFDPDLSFNDLGIKENDSIIVERYFTNLTEVSEIKIETDIVETEKSVDVINSELVKNEADGKDI